MPLPDGDGWGSSSRPSRFSYDSPTNRHGQAILLTRKGVAQGTARKCLCGHFPARRGGDVLQAQGRSAVQDGQARVRFGRTAIVTKDLRHPKGRPPRNTWARQVPGERRSTSGGEFQKRPAPGSSSPTGRTRSFEHATGRNPTGRSAMTDRLATAFIARLTAISQVLRASRPRSPRSSWRLRTPSPAWRASKAINRRQDRRQLAERPRRDLLYASADRLRYASDSGINVKPRRLAAAQAARARAAGLTPTSARDVASRARGGSATRS
jgi:hypothetical protein